MTWSPSFNSSCKTLLAGRTPAANLFALISPRIMEAISPRPVVALTLLVPQTLKGGRRVRQVCNWSIRSEPSVTSNRVSGEPSVSIIRVSGQPSGTSNRVSGQAYWVNFHRLEETLGNLVEWSYGKRWLIDSNYHPHLLCCQ